MTKIEMRQTGGDASPSQNGGPPPSTPPRPDTTLDFGMGLGSIDSVRKEIDDVYADMREFYNSEPDEVMRYCSGHSARLSELRTLTQRVEVVHRQWKPVRVNEIEPTLDELKNQFTIASRILSQRELDWKMAGGSA